MAQSSRRPDAAASLAVLSAFQRLVRLDRERHGAAGRERHAADAPICALTFEAGLARVYGPGVEPPFAENPALIGGMRIKVGSDVYDGSVRARLAALEARL